MRKKLKLLIPIVAILAIAMVIKFKLMNSEFIYVGTIEATKIDLSPRLASLIAIFEVKEGQKVQKDQVLLRLAGEDLKIAADIAELDYQRVVRLSKAGSVSQEMSDHLKYKRDESALKYSWTVIKAPTHGTILNTYREAGEWANPGMKLLTLADLSEVWAIIYVEQPIISRLSLGMTLEGSLPELTGRIFTGKITRINDEAEFTPKNVQTRAERTRLVYGIKVTFPNQDGILKSGMAIEVRLPDRR